MTRFLSLIIITASLNFMFYDLQSQNTIPFGDISLADLSNKPYLPDPGADAIILSDKGIATLNYGADGFYVELVRDVKIRIVNNNGFDYANIELPFSDNDDILDYQASTFNIRDGERMETKISNKSFIRERSTPSRKVLKFNFPDVHEGSVVEYSYRVKLKDYAVATLVQWEFQADIPVVSSILTIAYPEYFTFKNTISGSANMVRSTSATKDSYFGRQFMKIIYKTWYVNDMPAFRDEPFIKSREEHFTKINFELATVNIPGSTYEEITPTYQTLTKKLLERSDFGMALSQTGFLKKQAIELTSGLNDNLSKLKKLHEFVSEKILWNGVEDYTTSTSLRSIYKKEKGNSADINLMLIGMLRAVNIKAEPVILCTRSNGSINPYSAMIQQFNYVVAYVYADDNFYLVDATDPLRPFNVLPFDCLNGAGRLISEDDSKFVDLKNSEKDASFTTLNLQMDNKGDLTGELKVKYADYNAYDLRKIIKLEGRDGYFDLMKAAATEIEITDFNLENIELRDSDVVETVQIKIKNGTQNTGEKLLFNPFLSPVAYKNTFYQETRKFPIDFGAPIINQLELNLEIPDGLSVIEKPEDVILVLGKNDGKYTFACRLTGNRLMISSILRIDKTLFQPSEYSIVQDFYSNVLKKQAELIVLKKNQYD